MLSACGNKNNDNPSITAPTNSSSDNLTEQNVDSNEINWETENIEVPDIEDVTVSEITVPRMVLATVFFMQSHIYDDRRSVQLCDVQRDHKAHDGSEGSRYADPRRYLYR